MIFSTVMAFEGSEYYTHFRMIHAPGQLKFFVNLTTPFTQPISFEMKKEFGRWKVVLPTPDWLVEVEPMLGSIIKEKTGL